MNHINTTLLAIVGDDVLVTKALRFYQQQCGFLIFSFSNDSENLSIRHLVFQLESASTDGEPLKALVIDFDTSEQLSLIRERGGTILNVCKNLGDPLSIVDFDLQVRFLGDEDFERRLKLLIDNLCEAA